MKESELIGKLKSNLEEIELFKDCISTRDTEKDVSEFTAYVKSSLEITDQLGKRRTEN